MSAPQLGHFSLLMVHQESVNADNYAQQDGYNKPKTKESFEPWNEERTRAGLEAARARGRVAPSATKAE